MKVISYDKAHDQITELYLKHGKRVETEQKYLYSLRSLGVPEDGKQFREHKRLEQQYLARGAGIWEALMILSKLSEQAKIENAPQE